jgi:hypothetical protein
MNTGFRTLFMKEVLRFWKVGFQTVAAPVLTAVMYLFIFGHALDAHVEAFPGVGYTSFLIPGLVMMSVLQNAFANSSSSLVQSKITGNLVFLLVAPLSHRVWFAAYVVDHRLRGARCRHAGRARFDRRVVGRQVRPDGRVPELHHHADDVSVGRFLLGAFAAEGLAGGEPLEPVFLHDRRLSARVLWGQ